MVKENKKQVVQEINKLAKEYPIVGLVDLENLPAPQLQNMRETLRGKVVIVMTKKTLMRIALKGTPVEKIIESIRGMPALIFTKENPFALYKIIQKNKSSAPAKAGQTAPNDIVVPAGPTPFAPGPVIGELGAIGVKTGVEGGKIAIKEDSTVVREGEEIKANVAGLLTRLGIKPMEVGLNVLAVYEDGTIFTKKDLHIDEEEYITNLTNAHKWSINLAVETGVVNSMTIEIMLTKAIRDSTGLALEANIYADKLMGDLLARATSHAQGVKQAGKL